MAKYLGLLLLLITLFMVGCGPKVATDEQAKQGTDTLIGDQLGAEKGAKK